MLLVVPMFLYAASYNDTVLAIPTNCIWNGCASYQLEVLESVYYAFEGMWNGGHEAVVFCRLKYVVLHFLLVFFQV